MYLLQIKIDQELHDAVAEKAKEYGVPVSSMVRIALVNTFLKHLKDGHHEHSHESNGHHTNEDDHGKADGKPDRIIEIA